MADIRFVVDTGQAEAVLRAAGHTVLARMDRELGTSAQLLANEMRRRVPKASSRLATSIRRRKIAALMHEVVADGGHARYVEEGRRPGRMPPVSAIAEWLKVRGITPRDPNTPPAGLAFLVARKIGRDGIAPQSFARASLDALRAGINSRLQAAVVQGLRDAGAVA